MTTVFLYLLGSLGCYWYSFKFIKLYIFVKKWAVTEATVLYKKTEKRGKYSNAPGAYEVKVDYTYTFNNQKYKSDKVYLTELSGSRTNQTKATAEKIVKELPDKIMVYVNPTQPDQSVIFCTGITLYIIVGIIGIFCFLYGLTTLLNLLLQYFFL